ncbi:glycogen debranching N-terminal domain-containing protein [Micromonospora sp. DT63]|uniref:amylo-alpha-1,6-glucosidase n=1 Tax=Micromonospora sp. DT63 TaxID=3393441 RepID=UPI003CF1574B
MAVVRATPADPTVGMASVTGVSGDQRAIPPELGPDSLAVLSGPTFLYSDARGDVPPGSIGGLVHLDTRLISGWTLTVNGSELLLLRAETLEHYSAQYVLTNPELPGLPPNSLAMRRLRYVGDGFHERLELLSFQTEPVRVEVRLAVGVDFADLFEVKSVVRDRSAKIVRDHAADGSELCFSYRNGDFFAETRVRCATAADRIDGDDLVWDLWLLPREGRQLDLHVPLPPGMGVVEPVRGDIADVIHGRADDPLRRWTEDRAVLRSDNQTLERTIRQSRDDLAALRLDLEVKGQRILLPGAGLPWFLTVFGRDTLITAYQTLVAGPALAKGALLTLARLQGETCDDFTDEEPGKILHEVRSGELTRTGQKPYSPYYGTADATQLWLILLSEYWRWTCDDETVRHLHDNALAALRWIDEYGDRDGDGFVGAEANRISLAMIDAAEQFGHRLPEALSGYDRQRLLFAVPYPTACSPQAWAAGAPLALIRAMLGINPVDGRLTLDPDIPPEFGRITAHRVRAFGQEWGVEAVGTSGNVRLDAR